MDGIETRSNVNLLTPKRDSVRAAYNYAEHLHERRKMMQHWADYLNALKVGAAVIPLHRLAS